MNKWQIEVQKSLLDSEEAAIKELEKQYKRALKDINDKIKLFDYDIRQLEDAINADGLDDAAREVLKSQQRAKVYQKQYQEALKGQISGVVDNLHAQQYATIDKYLKECYTGGFVGTMYDISKQGIPLIMPIDQAAVVKAVLTDSKVKEGFYNALGVNYSSLKKSIAAEVSRGIASGLSYSVIARNINNASKSGLSNAKRIARTEGHRIAQTSADDARRGAISRGCDVVKQWDAALDSRTRDSHARVDGEIREEDEKFSNGLKFPGDPSGSAAEVINCRCVATTRARWALDESELETLKERAEYFGLDKTENFKDFEQKYLDATVKMAASPGRKNDWSQTAPRVFTEAEKLKVAKFAKERGITIGNIDSFDGDPDLLISELDTISKTRKKYGVKTPITVSSRIIDDDDFAEMNPKTFEITFNSKALRDRKVTEYNIRKDNFFASKYLEDIALHEVGHIVDKERKQNVVAILREAYYNAEGRHISPGYVRRYLQGAVSTSASLLDVEIVAEIIVRNQNKPNKFTKEFLSLFMGYNK